LKENPPFKRLFIIEKLKAKERKENMPRQARIIPQTGFLHIICRGNNKRKVFRYERDKNRYHQYLRDFKLEDKIDIYHYCLMNNHLHLIAGLNQDSNISRFMKRANLRYFYYYRKKYTYCGHLWQGRFKSKIIDSEEYLIQCGKYIELNPVRAGIITYPEDFKFSSYNYYAFGRKDLLITENPLYKDLGLQQKERQYTYRTMMLEEDVSEITTKQLSTHNILLYNK